jgi:hypothetical protein
MMFKRRTIEEIAEMICGNVEEGKKRLFVY